MTGTLRMGRSVTGSRSMSDRLSCDAVLFDCDGVLVDSEPITAEVLRLMLGELGWALTIEETMRLFTGKAVRDELALISAHTGRTVDEVWIGQFWERRNAALRERLEAVPGAAESVRELHRSLDGRIACASGADRGKVRMQLERAGILDCFEGRIFSGHELARNKPFPDVYLKAAETLGVDPARCVVVEDSVTGVTAGAAAGATVLGFSSPRAVSLGLSDPRALTAAGAVEIFSDMGRLPALLARRR